jgi:hypothetical protein
MKRTRFAVALLGMVIGCASLLQAQTTSQNSGPAVAPLDLSKLSSIEKVLEGMQTTSIGENGQTPSPFDVVVQFLQLNPGQAQAFAQLLQARQTTVAPLLQAIQQLTQQLQALLQSGGSPQQVGTVVIQIFGLQQQVAQVQQAFLANFVNLLNPDQQQRLQAVRIAEQLQPILPAFQQLYLF